MILVILSKHVAVAQDVRIDKFSAFTVADPAYIVQSGGSLPANGGLALKVLTTGSAIKVQLILTRPSLSSEEVGVALYITDYMTRPQVGSTVKGIQYTANGDDNTIITSNSFLNGVWVPSLQSSAYYVLNIRNNPLFSFSVSSNTPGVSTQANANNLLYAVTYNITTKKILEVSGWIPLTFSTPPFAPAAIITGISPNAALAGKPIRIDGFGFINAKEVNFQGGTIALPGFKIVDNRTIEMNVPTGCTSGLVTVKNTSNQVSNGYNFTIYNPIAPPVLQSFQAVSFPQVITQPTVLVPKYDLALNIINNGPGLLDYNVIAVNFNGVITKDIIFTSDFRLVVRIPPNITPGLVSLVTQSLGNSNGLPYIFPRPQNACNQVVCTDQCIAYGGTPIKLFGRLIADKNGATREVGDDWVFYNWLVSKKYFNEPVFDDGFSIEQVQWQSSTNNKDWYDIPSATARDYQPGPCYQTTYYRRVSSHIIGNFWTTWRGEWYKSNIVKVIPYVSVTPGLYKIHNRKTGQVLEIGGGGPATIADGTSANQWPYVGTANQQWNITATDTGVYKIVNRNSNQALEIGGSDWNMLQPGSVAHQWTDWADNGGKNQQWLFQPVDGAPGYYTITNANSGQVLEIGGGAPVNTQPGAVANQWPYAGKDFYEQQWELVPVNVQTSTRFPGVYTIKNVNSQKLLEIGGASTDNGATANQWSNAGTANQQWTFVETGNGFFKIINRNSGSVLRIGSSSNVANQGGYTGALNEQWYVNEITPGVFKITIRSNSTQALEIQAAYTFDGATADVWPYWGGTNQQWILTMKPGLNKVASPLATATSQQHKIMQPLGTDFDYQLEAVPRLLLYPNPAGAVLNFSLFSKTKITLVKISDMRGADILTIRYPGSKQVDISSLTAGVYLLTVSDGKRDFHQKFIKK